MKNSDLHKLLSELTLEEKIDQLLQVSGDFFRDDTALTGPVAEQTGITKQSVHLAGSVLGTMGAETIRSIQKEYMENHPHRIPLLFMLDVINGYRTIFPIPLAQGAAFDPDLTERCAHMAALEASVSGIHVTFSPMADLVRDARWGRVMESTGEDPMLNSLLAAAAVRGYQGEDLCEPDRIAACVKHFAGYGAPVGGREYNTVELSEHTFREFYLPAYQAGIEAGAALVMTSFNTLNGVPASANQSLMQKTLRDEMGFDGVLISDWAAIEEMIPHGFCQDRKEAAFRALLAGVDIDMMTSCYSENLRSLVEEGSLSEAQIDDAVFRVLQLKNRLGLFENPFHGADPEKEKTILVCDEHRALAREAARKSFVLLKNENHLLPLPEDRKIAFIGPYLTERNMNGSWSFFSHPEDGLTVEEAAREHFGACTNIRFCQGYELSDGDTKLQGFGEAAYTNIASEAKATLTQEALEAAKEAETVVLFLGEHRLQSGEAASRAHLDLPHAQQELFDAVCQVNPNTVVILFTGRPLDIRELSAKARSILVAWMPGTEGARALMDVLSGAFSPQGKLSMSFPYCVGQVPVYYNQYSTGRPDSPAYSADRFRSRYLDIPNAPLYPFGFGLGYTEFSVSDILLDKTTLHSDDRIFASVTVTNTGDREGTETVQLYLHDVSASVVRPVKELKQFQKVSLAPGESKQVAFAITESDLRFITQNNRWESEPGAFDVLIGTDSTTANGARFLYERES